MRQLAANSNSDLLYLAALSAAAEADIPKEVALEFAAQAQSYKDENSQWPKGFM